MTASLPTQGPLPQAFVLPRAHWWELHCVVRPGVPVEQVRFSYHLTRGAAERSAARWNDRDDVVTSVTVPPNRTVM